MKRIAVHGKPRFIFPSYDIPIQWKYFGRFHAALIRSMDKKLAEYSSAYGYAFTDSPSIERKLKTFVEMNVPISIRLAKRAHERGKMTNFPYYLGEDYIDIVFNKKKMQIDEFVNVNAIKDSITLSRALSVELLVSGIC